MSTSFVANDTLLSAPFRITSLGSRAQTPARLLPQSGYTRRAGDRGFTFLPAAALTGPAFYDGAVFQLFNARRDRYDAVDLSLRHTFAGKFEWFAGYTRSSSRSNAAVDYSLENPIFGPQGRGPTPGTRPTAFTCGVGLRFPSAFCRRASTF